MRAAAASSLVLVAACWGSGPTPGKPAKATILYQLTPPAQNTCGPQKYIGPIAFGPVYGFAGLLPYQPQANCNNSGGNMPGSSDVPIYEFPVEGNGAAQMVANAGMSDGTYSPRLQALAGANNNVMWLSAPASNTGMSQINFAGAPTMLAYQFSEGGGFYGPVGLLHDADYFYVAAVQANTNGKAEPNNPNYPCCGPTQMPQTSLFARIKPPDVDPIEVTNLPVAPLFDCSHTSRCVVQNSTQLIYLAFENATNSSWKVARFPKDGTMATDEFTLSHFSPGSDGLIPVGFHATDANVVWSRSRSYDQGATGSTPACEIDRYDLNGSMDLGPIFTTRAFDCAGITTDDESVYFTINATTSSNGSEQMRGLGIGRVHLDSGQVETIRIGVLGSTSGPRRVLLDDTDMIVVDPFTIARIPISALDGQHDFTL